MTTDHYHRGVALLNSGEFYDAHEVLEDAWRESTGSVKLFRQALVQIAVSMHHHSTGNLNGSRSVLARAIRNITPFEQGFEGLDLDDLRKQLAVWSSALSESSSGAPPLRVKWLSLENTPKP
jgi:predicted metal-dependent hydrolase